LPALPGGSDTLCAILPALRLIPEQHFPTKFSGQYPGRQSATGAGQQTGCKSFYTGSQAEGNGERFFARANRNTGIRTLAIARKLYLPSIYYAFVDAFVYSAQTLYANGRAAATVCARSDSRTAVIVCRHEYEAALTAWTGWAGSAI
jgi:hypothetical protein